MNQLFNPLKNALDVSVGYGDLVPTFQAHQEREFHVYFLIYEIFIIFWNIAGLGYVLMLINFVAKGMKSKRMAKLEHKISENIRATEHLVRQEVSKDLNFLRRLLNEANFLKVKPVYTGKISKRSSYFLPRSWSCPDLLMYQCKALSHPLQARSYSLATDSLMQRGSTALIKKSQSDSDLHYIDRQKTFRNSSNSFGNDDLITKVVSALGSIQQVADDEQSFSEAGVNGLSDSQILSSERRFSGWSLNRSDASRMDSLDGFVQFTWNGRTANDFGASLNAKDATVSSRPITYNRSVSLDIPDNDNNLQSIVNREIVQRMLNRTNSPKSRLLTYREKRNSVVFPEMMGSQSNLDRKKAKRESVISLPREYIATTSKRRSSILSILDTPINTSKSELLEKTSIADLIRALEVVHATPPKDDVRKNASPKIKNHLSQIINSRRGSLNPNVNSRRVSLCPIPSYTTIFTSSDGMDPVRKISSQSTPDPSLLSRQSSLRPRYPPPQYSAIAKPTVNRFNVRPSNTSPERGNSSSMPPSIFLQKKLPHGPSPLARNT